MKVKPIGIIHTPFKHGTPLLDIKPYVPDFEPGEKIKIGWLKGKIK